MTLGASLLFLPSAHAQQTPPTRFDFAYYIYVDPLFGDNAAATANNPAVGSPVPPLGVHTEVGSPQPIGGVLQHAPFPFRTLTGPQGAIAYANLFLTPLYQVTPIPGYTATIRYVVIQCLPGLYGPRLQGQPDIDPNSGIPFNGEAWPAVIPAGLSIQGTSALDTIFDAREQVATILEVRQSGDNHFIDGVTIRNARGTGDEQPGAGAGIWIWSPTGMSARIRITNCFITNNLVGIGIDAREGGQPMRPRIINNTIAWNGIGLWAGNSATGGVSNHAPAVFNNIFDSGSPPGNIAGISGFEGLSNQDKQVVSRGATALNPPDGIDFNAWEVGFVNLGVGAGTNWPITLPNNTSAPNGPAVDLAPITRGSSGRGALYINDIFRLSGAGGAGVDHSPHDFRLAPLVTDDPNVQPSPINPLVGQGIDGTVGPAFLALVMANGASIPSPPGLPLAAEEVPLHGWDWDGEGFGNPRIQARAGFDNNPNGSIDIGADEMGALIMAGYVNGTRIFTDAAPSGPGVTDHSAVYFFDLPALGAQNRPETNMYQGMFFDWYDHVQNAPDAAVMLPPTNMTELTGIFPFVGPTVRWLDIGNVPQPNPAYQFIMRNRVCDFSPHLQPDLHPFWGPLMFVQPPTPPVPGDIYASNPWYNHGTLPPPWGYTLATRDNPALFHNLGGTFSNRWSYSGPLYGVTFVTEAHLNPPGTFFQGPRITIAPTAVFGPYTPCTGTSPTTYTVGPWGFGDAAAGCPDRIPLTAPGTNAWGMRFNCERIVNGGTASNLQTFLGLVTAIDAADPEEARLRGRSMTTRPRQPTEQELRNVLRDAMEFAASRRGSGR